MAQLSNNAKAGLVTALNGVLADTMAIYFKSKNFHWHVAGSNFRDLHLMFDEQAAQLIATVDDIGERDGLGAVDQAEGDARVAVVAKDALRHQQLVEIGVDDRPHDGVDLPVMRIDAGGNIGHRILFR